MKKLKIITSLLTIAVLICVLSVNAFAHEVPDTSKKGSISVTMKDGETVVSGGTLTLYKVGDVKDDDGNYGFELSAAFRESEVSLENLESEQVTQELAEYAKKHKIENETEEVDDEGMAIFSDLEVGLYLVVQEEPAEGYLAVNPFLVTVPIIEGDHYVYNVDASPKVDLDKAPETTTEEQTGEETTEEESTKEESTEKAEDTTKPAKPSLPLTGQLNWPVPVLVVLGLALISFGCTLKFGKKKGKV